MNTCLDWKSGEVVELAKQVGVESTPAFADKVGTLMDELGISSVMEVPTLSENQSIKNNLTNLPVIEKVDDRYSKSYPPTIGEFDTSKLIEIRDVLSDKSGKTTNVEDREYDWMGLIDFTPTDKQYKYISKNIGILEKIRDKNEFSETTLLDDVIKILNSHYKLIDKNQLKIDFEDEYQAETQKVNNEIDKLFSNNPEISNIGNKEEYLAYINNVFPDSKVKDIAYKGYGGSQYFSSSEEYANDYGGNASAYIFNLKNPMYISNFNKKYDNKELKFVVGDKLIADKYSSAVSLLWALDQPLAMKFDREFKDSDSIIGPEAGFEKYTTYYIKDTSNYHRLGSEQDVEGFKNFIEKHNLQPQLPTVEQVKEYLDKNKPSESIEIKDGKVKVNPQGLSHAEVMLPAWTKKFFAKEFQDENGDVDFEAINRLLPEVMDMVGYRIPTEDKYSMLPLRVVDFLPSSSGGGIMLPAEITKIAGSDFDVDKMYVMFKQLRRNSKGVLEVERYLDKKNSTLQERKEVYINNLPEATTIKLEYKDKIKSINEEIRKVKIDKDSLKDLIAKSGALATEWRDLDEEIDTLTNPSDIVKEIYSSNGITNLTDYIGILTDALDDVKKEHKSINAQIDVLVAQGKVETEDGTKSKLDVLYEQKSKLYDERDAKILNLISDEAFDKISIPEQNTKTARDNRIIDINRGILQNPSTVESIFTPGGYDYLKNVIVKTITERLGNTNKATDIFDADHVDLMTVQNTAGRDLKGIAASHNKFRALMQHSNMKLVSPVEFDGKEFSDLSGNEVGQKSTDGRSITRNVSEPLAASVDNGKDPILALINYNSQTADLIFMLLSLGVAPMTVYSFINQAPIRNAMKRVSLGKAFSLEGALKDMYKELTDNPFSMKKTGVSAFTGKSLLESLNDTNSGHSIKVITTALHYMNSAKDLNLVTRASKADTAGAGKFTEEAITLLATIDKAKDIQTIEGVTEFLSGTDANKLVNSFTEEGVKKPVEEVLSKTLPYNNELFKKIKKTIADGSTFTVTADENRDIDAAVVQLLMSDFSFYSTKEESNIFVQGIPVIFSRLKKEFADELLKNDLFNALTIEKIGGAYTLDIVKFDNNLTASPERKEAIQKAWKELNSPYSEKAYIDHLNEIKFLGKAWDINNVTTSFTEGFKTTGETRKLFMNYMLHRFSENLLKYSFLTTGNNFTPKGLSTLIPLSLYLSKNPTNKAKDIMTEDSSVKITKFIDQFYRHNAFNTKFVPRARTKFKDISGNVLEVNDNKLIIDAKEPDPSFYTMETDGTTGERNKIFKPFVSFKTKEGKLNLYELALESDTEVVYKRTYKMGIKGQIFEYNLNSNKSIIEENNLTEEENKAIEQSIKCKI